MYPSFANVPVWFFLMVGAGVVGATMFGKNVLEKIAFGIGCAALGLGIGLWRFPSADYAIPIQNYGVLMLTGFVVTMGFAEYRARQIGAPDWHVIDMSLMGAIFCLFWARVFYVAMNWQEYNPNSPDGFKWSQVARMAMMWQGGLVFYGAFLAAFVWIYGYSKLKKVPAIPMMDLIGSGFLGGQFFGRLGCFMTGCCFGKVCSLPWGVEFPKNSPAYEQQLRSGLIPPDALHALRVHPTQLYAALAALLAYVFLQLYWPRRKYDGQILSLTMIMAGATRFFEEALRIDDMPPFPSISTSLTIAQYLAVVLVAVGFGLLFYFRAKNELWHGDHAVAVGRPKATEEPTPA